MEIGIVGLGRMGANMARRLCKDGHRVIGYNRSPETTAALVEEIGIVGVDTLEELVAAYQRKPRAIWVMVPAGAPVETIISDLGTLVDEGDIIIDGGNSNYRHSMQRAKVLAEKGIVMVDVGTSGGVWGLAEGYSMMVGGPEAAVAHIAPALQSLAPGKHKGWGHVGPSGAGHFVKMVHNGIEYGLMEAYAEGFEIMKAKEAFDLDLKQIAEVWRFGSVIRSWLLDLTAAALAEDQELSSIRGWVADSGEGRWTVMEAIDLDIPAPVITLSLMARFVSRQEDSFAAKLLAAMRNQFGGHAVRHIAEEKKGATAEEAQHDR